VFGGKHGGVTVVDLVFVVTGISHYNTNYRHDMSCHA